MWVTDFTADKIFAYNMDTKARDPGKDFDTLSQQATTSPYISGRTAPPCGLSTEDGILYAYRMADKQYVPSRNFNTLASAGNTSPRGIWSDGSTMWVSDPADDKIYSYNMANSAPTAADSSVTATGPYTFVADDFNFADPTPRIRCKRSRS